MQKKTGVHAAKQSRTAKQSYTDEHRAAQMNRATYR